MTPPENDPRDAVAWVDFLTVFPELKDRIIAAFGKAAWTDQGGISVHGSDDGGRIAMNHSGWAALPVLLDEALSPVAVELERVTAQREAERVEATRLRALVVERDEATRRIYLESLREAHRGFAMIHDALAESTQPKQACGELCAHWRDRFGGEIERHVAALDKAPTPKEPA